MPSTMNQAENSNLPIPIQCDLSMDWVPLTPSKLPDLHFSTTLEEGAIICGEVQSFRLVL